MHAWGDFFHKGTYMQGSIDAGQNNSRREYEGIAVCDKADNSRDLKVYCKDLLFLMQGELQAKNVDSISKSVDKNGVATTSSATCKNYIDCTYGGDFACSNRAYPPDVRKGEIVKIFQYGDSDQWYWIGCDRSQSLRKTERVRWQVNDTLENDCNLTDDNTYFLEMDTRKHKHILLSTSQSDGEEHQYKFKISPETSQIMLADEKQNMFIIDTNKQCITMANEKGSLIQLDGEDINIICKGKLTIRSTNNEIVMAAKSDITQQTKSNFNASADGDMTLKFKGTGKHGGGSSLTLGASSISFAKGI